MSRGRSKSISIAIALNGNDSSSSSSACIDPCQQICPPQCQPICPPQCQPICPPQCQPAVNCQQICYTESVYPSRLNDICGRTVYSSGNNNCGGSYFGRERSRSRHYQYNARDDICLPSVRQEVRGLPIRYAARDDICLPSVRQEVRGLPVQYATGPTKSYRENFFAPSVGRFYRDEYCAPAKSFREVLPLPVQRATKSIREEFIQPAKSYREINIQPASSYRDDCYTTLGQQVNQGQIFRDDSSHLLQQRRVSNVISIPQQQLTIRPSLKASTPNINLLSDVCGEQTIGRASLYNNNEFTVQNVAQTNNIGNYRNSQIFKSSNAINVESLIPSNLPPLPPSKISYVDDFSSSSRLNLKNDILSSGRTLNFESGIGNTNLAQSTSKLTLDDLCGSTATSSKLNLNDICAPPSPQLISPPLPRPTPVPIRFESVVRPSRSRIIRSKTPMRIPIDVCAPPAPQPQIYLPPPPQPVPIPQPASRSICIEVKTTTQMAPPAPVYQPPPPPPQPIILPPEPQMPIVPATPTINLPPQPAPSAYLPQTPLCLAPPQPSISIPAVPLCLAPPAPIAAPTLQIPNPAPLPAPLPRPAPVQLPLSLPPPQPAAMPMAPMAPPRPAMCGPNVCPPIVTMVPKVDVATSFEVVPREQVIRWNEIIPRSQLRYSYEMKQIKNPFC